MTARPVPLPCGPTPDPAQPYSGAWKREDDSGLCPTCKNEWPEICSNSFHREAELRAQAHAGPARTALRPADAEAHTPEETR